MTVIVCLYEDSSLPPFDEPPDMVPKRESPSDMMILQPG